MSTSLAKISFADRTICQFIKTGVKNNIVAATIYKWYFHNKIPYLMCSEQAINDAFAHAQKAKLTKEEGKASLCIFRHMFL